MNANAGCTRPWFDRARATKWPPRGWGVWPEINKNLIQRRYEVPSRRMKEYAPSLRLKRLRPTLNVTPSQSLCPRRRVTGPRHPSSRTDQSKSCNARIQRACLDPHRHGEIGGLDDGVCEMRPHCFSSAAICASICGIHVKRSASSLFCFSSDFKMSSEADRCSSARTWSNPANRHRGITENTRI